METVRNCYPCFHYQPFFKVISVLPCKRYVRSIDCRARPAYLASFLLLLHMAIPCCPDLMQPQAI